MGRPPRDLQQAHRSEHDGTCRVHAIPDGVEPGVPGVVAVDVDALYRDPAVPLAPRLLAELPYVDSAGETLAAELLTLDPAPPTRRVSG